MRRTVCKALAPVEVTDDDATGPGTFEVVLSDATMDRDGESIDPGDFEPMPEWLSADMDHEMSCLSTVGSGAVSRDGDRVICRGTFASTDAGQTLRKLVAEKHIRNVSVAFLRNSQKMATDRGVARKELLNFAFTPVPANPSASVLASKAAKDGRRNSASDQQHIQEAHDALVSAGADCDDGEKRTGRAAARKQLVARGGKTIMGSLEALQDRAVTALEDAYESELAGGYYSGGWWFLDLHGIVADSDTAGTLYFDVYVAGDGMTSFSQSYTDDGRTVTLGDDQTEVELLEVVLPAADAADPGDGTVDTASVDDAAAVVMSAQAAALAVLAQ